jgi:phospholipase C
MTQHTDRRDFLKLMGVGGLAAAMPQNMPQNIQALAAVPANNRTGSIKDVEHIVVLTQENRSFDHYFGSMRGVRGFGDPRAVRLPSGKPVWNQQNGTGELLPYRPTDTMGRTFLPDPPHGWNDTHGAWNGGRHDQWVPQKGIVTMTHNTRADLPYHFALADAFTICDAYHCSVMGPTDPNRYHLWTGWLGNDGNGGGPVITNAEAGYDWSSFPERLEKAGVSWKIYQDVGVGLDAAGFWGWTGDQPYIGNYGDNSLLYLHQYQNAQPGNPLADKAKVGTNIAKGGTLFDQFRADVASGNLPQVSWIAAPEAYTEHPNWAPDFGAWYISQFVDILAANPDVWSKTVLFLNYDEEGGFFDHMVPPTPPASPELGASTVEVTNEIFPGDGNHPSAPYGLGMRVPMIVISPWSKGGWVNSQVFDHTSVIKFIEKRFGDLGPGLIEANITPWRRAVVGDLTSAFDFRRPDARPVRRPSTAAFVPPDTRFYPDQVLTAPTGQVMPRQEPGVRPARALPYVLDARAAVLGDGTVRVELTNSGSAAAVFQVRSGKAADAPRSYTVGAAKLLSGTWSTSGGYDLAVHGPGGFFRGFVGATTGSGAGLEVQASAAGEGEILTLTVVNRGSGPVSVSVLDAYSGRVARRAVKGGDRFTRSWSVDETGGWYDLAVSADGDAGFGRRFAGHLENGQVSTSDPMLGRRSS